MLSRLFGWFRKSPGSNKARNKKPARAGSATAHLYEKNAPPDRKPRPAAGNPGGGFDPYDTGKFDRSASWERISTTQR